MDIQYCLFPLSHLTVPISPRVSKILFKHSSWLPSHPQLLSIRFSTASQVSTLTARANEDQQRGWHLTSARHLLEEDEHSPLVFYQPPNKNTLCTFSAMKINREKLYDNGVGRSEGRAHVVSIEVNCRKDCQSQTPTDEASREENHQSQAQEKRCTLSLLQVGDCQAAQPTGNGPLLDFPLSSNGLWFSTNPPTFSFSSIK